MLLFEGVEGIKVFDPRDNEWKVSDNPALIFGYFVTKKQGALVGEGFWPGIAKWADWMDEKVGGE